MNEDPSRRVEVQAELGDFLRSRRARITPRQAGIADDAGARRVPGLRRAEVARLAGVSVDYYVQLERSRRVNVSDAVLHAVSRALQLDELERAHLFSLARPARSRPRPLPAQEVSPGLRRLLDAVNGTPAIVIGRRTDVLAVNALGRALLTDFEARPLRDRNMARYVFLDESARRLYDDWEGAARVIVATLNLYAGRHPRDPLLGELVQDLSVRDADFRRWWASRDVYRQTYGTRRYCHPQAGTMLLDYADVTPADDPEQLLRVMTAEAGSESADGLRLLATQEAGD